MAEYIEREATLNVLRNLGSRDYRREKGTIADAMKMIMHPHYTPSADVVEVRHGKWVAKPQEFYIGDTEWMCSNCKEEFCPLEMSSDDFLETMKYCPNCGAKMDGKEQDNG